MMSLGTKIILGLIIVGGVLVGSTYFVKHEAAPAVQTGALTPTSPSPSHGAAIEDNVWGSTDKYMVAAMTDIFVGTVTEKITNGPARVQVVYTVKGDAAGTVVVDQRTPDRSDYAIRTGSTYLLIARRVKPDGVYLVQDTPKALKPLSDDTTLSPTQLNELARRDTRVQELLTAYVNENQTSFISSRDRNSFATLTDAEKQSVFDKFKDLIPPRPVPAVDLPPPPPAIETVCIDKADNDQDGLIDVKDPDCADDLAENNYGRCHDKIDDDMDGLVDAADPDCANVPPPPPPPQRGPSQNNW